MKPYRMTIHCSASKNGERLPARTIEQWHKDRGFQTIGYHMVIQPDGEMERGRWLNVQGAHVEGENEGNIGICLIGLDQFTRKQFDVLRYQIDTICQTYNIPPWEIWTHAQFASAQKQGKTCPNITINRLIAWYVGHREDALEGCLLPTS